MQRRLLSQKAEADGRHQTRRQQRHRRSAMFRVQFLSHYFGTFFLHGSPDSVTAPPPLPPAPALDIEIDLKKPRPDLALGCPCGDEECKKKICNKPEPPQYDVCQLSKGLSCSNVNCNMSCPDLQIPFHYQLFFAHLRRRQSLVVVIKQLCPAETMAPQCACPEKKELEPDLEDINVVEQSEVVDLHSSHSLKSLFESYV